MADNVLCGLVVVVGLVFVWYFGFVFWLVGFFWVWSGLFFVYIILLQSLHLLMEQNYRAWQGPFKRPSSWGLGPGRSRSSAVWRSSPRPDECTSDAVTTAHSSSSIHSYSRKNTVLYWHLHLPTPLFFAKNFIGVCSWSSSGWMDFTQETHTRLQCTAVLWNLTIKKHLHLVCLALALY